MTLKEYLSETYDIMGEREKKKESLRKWKEARQEFDDNIAKVSDEEWKEAKRQLAHNVLNGRYVRGKFIGSKKPYPENLEEYKTELEERKKAISAAYGSMKKIVDVYKESGMIVPADLQRQVNDLEEQIKMIDKDLETLSKPQPRLSGKLKAFVPGSNKPQTIKTTKQKMIDKMIADANLDRKIAKHSMSWKKD